MSEFIFSPAVQGNLPIGTGNFYVVKYTGTFAELLSSSYLSDNFNDKDMLHISSSDVVGAYLFNSTSSQLDIVISGSINWGQILGTLSDQTDLNDSLNDKINVSDIATGSDIEAQTVGKVIDATAIVDDITLASNSKQKIPSEFSVKGYVDEKVSGVYKPAGTWDASSGSFPSGAKEGDTYYVDVAGTVDSIDFTVGDKLSARIDHPSKNTYANNWTKFDNNDDVTTVHGRTGVVTANNGDYNASQVTNTPSGDITSTTVQNAIDELDARLPISYAIYKLSSNVSTNMSNGDHCPFNTTRINIDPNSLQTLGTSAYATSTGVNCIGRVNLKAGYYYKVTGFITSTGTASYFGFSIWDVTSTATQIGTYGNSFAMPNSDTNVDSVPSFAIVQATADTIIELRKTGGTIVQWYAGNNNLSECFMMVEVLGKI